MGHDDLQPDSFAHAARPGAARPTADASLGARAVAALAALRCKLQGHAPALCIDDRRVYLACPDCHVESPGWRLDDKAPRPRFAGAPDRFARYAWVTGQRSLRS